MASEARRRVSRAPSGGRSASAASDGCGNRQVLIDSSHPSLVCAPIGSTIRGLMTEVVVGPEVGLKAIRAIHCDDLRSVAKSSLTDYIGSLGLELTKKLDTALAIALDLDVSDLVE